MRFPFGIDRCAVVSLLTGCVAPRPNPMTLITRRCCRARRCLAAANNGSIYQAGFEQNLYSDRKAYRVGDIITITLSEKMAASKTASSESARPAKPALA